MVGYPSERLTSFTSARRRRLTRYGAIYSVRRAASGVHDGPEHPQEVLAHDHVDRVGWVAALG